MDKKFCEIILGIRNGNLEQMKERIISLYGTDKQSAIEELFLLDNKDTLSVGDKFIENDGKICTITKLHDFKLYNIRKNVFEIGVAYGYESPSGERSVCTYYDIKHWEYLDEMCNQ